jgi:hypothetical protein
MNFRGRVNGFEYRTIEHATPVTVVGLAQERDSDQFVRFNLLPAADFPVNQKYWNRNGNDGASAIWDWNYNVKRLRERPSYWKVAEHYRQATAIPAT